jgi:hypothetical protein
VSNTLYVTPAQVLAAQLAVELSGEAGEEPDEALKAIANARVEADEQSADDAQGAKVADPAELDEATTDLLSALAEAVRASPEPRESSVNSRTATVSVEDGNVVVRFSEPVTDSEGASPHTGYTDPADEFDSEPRSQSR